MVEVLNRTVLLRIVDTPGLNDTDEKDLDHMQKVLQFLIDVRYDQPSILIFLHPALREISCVMLCVEFQWKRDPQTIQTIRLKARIFFFWF